MLDDKWHSLKSGPETRDPGHWDLEPWNLKTLGPWNPETLKPETRDPGPWDPRLWNSETQIHWTLELGPWNSGPWNWVMRLGNCDPEAQNPEYRTMRIELVTNILTIPTRTTNWINFLHALIVKQILIIKSHGIWVENLGARVDGPKHLPKYFDIWYNTKKSENI